ncbi:hypothetical protein E8D34_04615 [Nocardioides sp. GY 10113]|uniref:hypothetical protein n=1 Tax=Nocardioides sp. GY 10113 TaxID=2569761 RepID=UPI0010A8BEDC|nr:hypothetical protein [Nocardioides sp. GY 10113]TIC88230.1 hypothetical protein E8D34_04615 [Nocardioides sp. GY 10113]
MTALLMSVIMVATALTVDLGVQRVLRSDLQALVDAVALDLSRELTGGPVVSYLPSDLAALDGAVAASVARNRAVAGGAVNRADVDWSFVVRDRVTGRYRTAASAEVPTGVQVTAAASIDLAFDGFTGVDAAGAVRSAVASTTRRACLLVGSYVEEFRSGESWVLDPVLGGLLGTEVGTSFLDPDNGLVGVDISLFELIDAIGPLLAVDVDAMSFDEILGTQISVGNLVLATQHVLERESGLTSELDLLRQLWGGIQLNLPHVDITLGELFELDTAAEAAVDVTVNVFDLLTGALVVANGNRVIDLPSGVTLPLPIGAGGGRLVDMTARLTVGQRPVLSCDGTASSSQRVIELRGDIVNLDLGGLIRVRTPITVRLTLGDARASVRDVACLPSGAVRVSTAVTSAMVGIDIRLGQRAGEPSSPKMRVALLDVGLPRWDGVEVISGTIALTSGAVANRPVVLHDFDVPRDDYSAVLDIAPRGVGLPAVGLAFNDLALLGGLGPLSTLLRILNVTDLLQTTVNLILDGLVNPLVASIDTWLMAPLMAAFGVSAAGGTVQVAPGVDCGVPRLIG